MCMLNVGIVGLPNVGKSTLFNAILKREQALSANYPFATIEPNVGVVEVIDDRLNKLAECILEETGVNPPKVHPRIEFVDIAGLVQGASKGEGLGNQFLANIREVDMIIHVVRDFNDPDIVREHSKDPETDSEVINSELLIKDIESVEKKIKSYGQDPKHQKEIQLLKQYLEHMNQGNLAISLRNQIDQKDYLEFIAPLFLLTDKEMIYVFNVAEDDARLKENKTYEFRTLPMIVINAKLESELSSLSEEDQKAYLDELGIKESGLNKVARTCFEKLGLISFLTAGEKEVKAWEIKKDTNAKDASGRIHTDFVNNFIKADVIKFEDYIKYRTRLACKDAGKLRSEGKEYIVQDGDVIEFKIGSGK